MNRDQFVSKVMNYGNSKLAITIYNGDEISVRFKMYAESFNDYDDEFVIYGVENDFVILDATNITIQIDEYDETEFIFGADDHKIGIVFMA